jgi:uncharacterized membrane protein
MIVAGIALAGIFVALYLFLYKIGVVGNLSCSIGSCETVNLSRWAFFLGVPVAAWGVGFYVVMFILAVASLQDRYADSTGIAKIITGASSIGFVFTIWLTYLELFVINAICQWCVISALLVTTMFAFSTADLRERTARISELPE